MECVRSGRLQAIDGVRHGFFYPGIQRSLKENLSFKSAPKDTVQAARQRACGILEIPYDTLTHVYQEHGSNVWTIGLNHRGAGALTGENPAGNGDAMITREPNLPLAILIADCLPIFYAAQDACAVGLAHAGWRGTFDDIAVKVVQKMQADYHVRPQDVKVWIGPGISKTGFTVGQDVWDLFQDKWGDYSECFDAETQSIDLKKINKKCLEASGVLAENIDVSEDCTYCDRRFFSYRRDGKGSGHNMAVIMRE